MTTSLAPVLQHTQLPLADLVRRASYLWERAAAPSGSIDRRSEAAVQQRLQIWQKRLSASLLAPEQALQQRLAWDGLDEQHAAALLSEHGPSPWAQLPGWAHTLAELSAAWSWADPDDRAETTAAVPFAQLLQPLVRLARDRLQRDRAHAGIGTAPDPLSPAAHDQLEWTLLRRLAEVAAPTLQHDFEATLPVGERWLRRFAAPDPAAGTARYQAFVTAVIQDGGTALLQSYPVLGRLLATAIEQWVHNTAELMGRLVDDSGLLQTWFAAGGRALGPVVALRAAQSDAHCGGHGTVLLKFDSGLRLVYKPKSLALDVAYNDLLDWCNARHGLLAMQSTAVLDRGAYGWCAFVPHQPCADRAAVARFYRRAGQLLAFMHLLRGTDAHLENLIADGEQPVLIDTETLCHPELHPDAGFGRPAQMSAGVLRTGLLPVVEPEPGHDLHRGDISGLSWPDDPAAAEAGMAWVGTNTDAMQLRPVTRHPGRSHAPRCEQQQLPPEDFEAELQHGFDTMYRFLAAERDRLLAADGPLVDWRGLPVRHVFRETEVYALIQTHSLQPAALRNGTDFSLELERLSCAFLRGMHRPAAWPLLALEQRALGQLDLPFLLSRTDDDGLHDGGGGVVPRVLEGASWNALAAQLRACSDEDLACQRQAIAASLAACRARRGAPTMEDDSP